VTGPWEASLGRIRIVRRPEGEAPEWVRDAWIGIELPLLHPAAIESRIVGGVLTMPKTRLGHWLSVLMGRSRVVSGYLVDANDAVRRLEGRNPTAAIWWRTNAAWCVQPGGQFIFDRPACERIG
jgi:hypothetical protein